MVDILRVPDSDLFRSGQQSGLTYRLLMCSSNHSDNSCLLRRSLGKSKSGTVLATYDTQKDPNGTALIED